MNKVLHKFGFGLQTTEEGMVRLYKFDRDVAKEEVYGFITDDAIVEEIPISDFSIPKKTFFEKWRR